MVCNQPCHSQCTVATHDQIICINCVQQAERNQQIHVFRAEQERMRERFGVARQFSRRSPICGTSCFDDWFRNGSSRCRCFWSCRRHGKELLCGWKTDVAISTTCDLCTSTTLSTTTSSTRTAPTTSRTRPFVIGADPRTRRDSSFASRTYLGEGPKFQIRDGTSFRGRSVRIWWRGGSRRGT